MEQEVSLYSWSPPVILNITLRQFTPDVLFGSLTVLFLLCISALVSGAEVAFFSLTPQQISSIRNAKSRTGQMIIRQLLAPKKLLATLLIANNFVNVGIIIISSVITMKLFDFAGNEVIGFLIQVIAITFIIVFFGEVMPKVYATKNAINFAHITIFPVFFLEKIFNPFSTVLVASTSFIEKQLKQKNYNVTLDELSHAIDLTTKNIPQEKERTILKGIVKLGNIDVKQVMTSRLDVMAFDESAGYSKVIAGILDSAHSRIPVYKGNFDKVTGVLYIKDLLPYFGKEENFNWKALVRPPFFVPESKKINDLLIEFQERKMHLAIVVDEYGGTSGIVTMEDILEEIVGEINDEFDDDELSYSRLDEYNFVFEGKTLLNDVCRVTGLEKNLFDAVKADVDTLAGLLLELSGKIPVKEEVITFRNIRFTVESSDKRSVKRVRITLPGKNDDIDKKQFVPGALMWMMMNCFLFFSCGDSTVPRPRGYFRIDAPEKKYLTFQSDSCPYTFEYPSYALALPDTGLHAEHCWMNIDFPAFKGKIHISYKAVSGNLKQYIEESRSLAMKHSVKANSINEKRISNNNGAGGLYYDIEGNAASSVQFYLTDSTTHFLRASLYFYCIPNRDSLAPVIDFIGKDIDRMIETFRFR